MRIGVRRWRNSSLNVAAGTRRERCQDFRAAGWVAMWADRAIVKYIWQVQKSPPLIYTFGEYMIAPYLI